MNEPTESFGKQTFKARVEKEDDLVESKKGLYLEKETQGRMISHKQSISRRGWSQC